jgi:hypothetical protein
MKKYFISKLVLVFVLLVLMIVNSNLNWNKTNWKEIIRVDGKGYYAYLPAIFIYHDLNFGFFETIDKVKYFNSNNFYDYRVKVNKTYIDKYYCGTSIAQLPFFLIAHLWCYFSDSDPDGYSKPYMILISIAALFYLGLGLLFILKILLSYGVSDKNISIVLIAIVFGTNIFYYSIREAGMSHIYSFAFFSMLVYYGRLFFRFFRPVDILRVTVLLGLLTLIRPVNCISFLILPFLACDIQTLKAGIVQVWYRKLYLILSIVIFVFLVSIQLIIYKVSTGNFFIYSYHEEGFNFLNPHMVDILFSYRKGLFLYTPVLFISLWGGYYLFRKNKFEFFSLSLFLLILTYILSSWFLWWYGGSFSSRVYIEYFPLFAILLGLALENIRSPVFRKVYITIIFLLIVVCQVQTYQYRYYKIHWSDMTKEKYWDVFLRIDKLIKAPEEDRK